MSKTPLRLLPEIAKAAQARSKQLRQPVSGYVALLISNYEVEPFSIEAQAADEKLARVNVGMSWRGDLRKRATRLARAAGLNANSFVEALIAAELISPAQDFVIRARAPKPKIRSHDHHSPGRDRRHPGGDPFLHEKTDRLHRA